MSDITDASTWDKNPIIAKWKADITARGGKALESGYPYPPNKGAPAAMFLDNGVAGARRYEMAPPNVQLAVGFQRNMDKVQIAAGELAEKAEAALDATGLNQGVFGFVGKVLGLPRGAVVVLVIGAALLAGYATLTGVGILPPLVKRTQ